MGEASVQVRFALVKDTKNTVVFDEVVPDGDAPIVGRLYVQKHAAAALRKQAGLADLQEIVVEIRVP